MAFVMDTMAAADACSIVVEDVLPCETTAAALRRRRIEIRRIRILANSAAVAAAAAAGFVEPLKRSRIIKAGGLTDERNNKKCKDLQDDAAAPIPAPAAAAAAVPTAAAVSLDSSSSDSASNDSSTVESSGPAIIQSHISSCCSAALDRCPSYGTISVCGRRREMEDAVAVVPDFITLPCSLGGCTSCSKDSIPSSSSSSSAFHFFGVYDGHSGSQAADFCRDRMHHALVEEISKALLISQEECWQRAMTSCFLKVDEEVRTPCSGEACSKCAGEGCEGLRVPENVGSTAVVAVVGGNLIVVANCGDSRAVLSRGGKAVPLSVDHKPGRPDEMARVEAAGGRVIKWDVLRILGILAMSRSIGDQYMCDFVIPDPEVTCTTRSDDDEFLILASDGLWDVISNEDACDIARRCFRKANAQDSSSSAAANDAACLLLKKALANGSKDNISIVVVNLARQQNKVV